MATAAVAVLVFALAASTSVASATCVTYQADVSFFLDSSGSVGSVGIRNALAFIDSFVDNVNIGDDDIRVAVVTGLDGGCVEYGFYFNDSADKSTLKQNLDILKGQFTYGGVCCPFNFNKGCGPMKNAFGFVAEDIHGQRRPDVPQIVVLLTDGQFGVQLSDRADTFDSKGINTTVIGVGSVDNVSLHYMASNPSDIFYITDIHSFDSIRAKFKEKICTIAQELDRKVTERKLRQVDVLFLVDSSASGQSSSAKTAGLVRDVVSGLNASGLDLRLSVVAFNDSVFTLVAPTNSSHDVIQGLQRLGFGGATDEVTALDDVLKRAPSRDRIMWVHEEQIGPRWVVVLVSDAMWLEWQAVFQRRDTLQRYGARLLLVCTGDPSSVALYRDLASADRYVFPVLERGGFRSLAADVRSAILEDPQQVNVTKPAPPCQDVESIVVVYHLCGGSRASVKSSVDGALSALSGNVSSHTVTCGGSSEEELAGLRSRVAGSQSVLVLVLDSSPSDPQRLLRLALHCQTLGLSVVTLSVGGKRETLGVLLRAASLARQALVVRDGGQLASQTWRLQTAVCGGCSARRDVALLLDGGPLPGALALLAAVLDGQAVVGPARTQVAVVSGPGPSPASLLTALPDKLAVYSALQRLLGSASSLPGLDPRSALLQVNGTVLSPLHGARADASRHVLVLSRAAGPWLSSSPSVRDLAAMGIDVTLVELGDQVTEVTRVNQTFSGQLLVSDDILEVASLVGQDWC